MGIIADMFQCQIDELKRIDEESQRRTNKLLRDIDILITGYDKLIEAYDQTAKEFSEISENLE